MKSNKKLKEWEHDPDYIRYVESGESAAVFVVRDVVKAVNTDHNKYLTWIAAHYDISQQRQEGYNEPKYLVLCTLHNKNKGRTISYKLRENHPPKYSASHKRKV